MTNMSASGVFSLVNWRKHTSSTSCPVSTTLNADLALNCARWNLVAASRSYTCAQDCLDTVQLALVVCNKNIILLCPPHKHTTTWRELEALKETGCPQWYLQLASPAPCQQLGAHPLTACRCDVSHIPPSLYCDEPHLGAVHCLAYTRFHASHITDRGTRMQECWW